MKVVLWRAGAAALLMALGGCTADAGVRNIAGPDSAKPLQNHVAAVNVCCSKTVYKGTTTAMEAYVYDWNNQRLFNESVLWTHSANGVASTTGAGNVVYIDAVAVGTTTIYAEVEGKLGSATLTVIAAPVVTSVQVTPSSVSLQVGQSQQLTAKAYDQYGNVMSGKTATWSIDHSTVASLSSGGSLQGVATGSTTARATIDGVTGTASVSVTPALYVSLSGTSMITSAGTYSWTASASGGDGTFSYQWEVDWNDTPFEGFVPIDTGNPFYMNIDGCDGSFEVRVRVSSGGSVTYAGGHFVENYASCW